MSLSRARAEDGSLLLRGSLITLKRKCGKPGCRCTRGELHTALALSYSIAGATKMLMLREEDLPLVRAALARYLRAQAALERHVLRSMEVLRRQRAREKANARLRGR